MRPIVEIIAEINEITVDTIPSKQCEIQTNEQPKMMNSVLIYNITTSN